MSKFIVKVWETEYDRDRGECDSSYFDTLEEALKLERKVHTIDISENSINNFILPKLDKGLIYE